jgi:HK97 family phage major capsid protein
LKTRLVTLTARKLALLGASSNELLDDAVSGFEAVYGASMIAAVSYFYDYYFLQGDGAGQPLGVLNDPALIVVTKESGQAANTILYQNVVKMFARLHPACLSSAVWIANSTTIPQLLAMQNIVANRANTENVGGSAVAVVTQNADGAMSLLTRPIIFTEKLPVLSSQGDLLLADLSQYAVGLRRGAAWKRACTLASRRTKRISASSPDSTVRERGNLRSLRRTATASHGALLWALAEEKAGRFGVRALNCTS